MEDYCKKSDFPCFSQLCTGDKQKWVDLLRQKTPAAVFLFMMNNSDKRNCYEGGGSKIASELRMRKQNVLTSIKLLNEQGYIRTEIINGKTYHWLCPDLVWRSTPKDRKLCGFIENIEKRPIYSFNNFVQIHFTLRMRALFLDCLIENATAYILYTYLIIIMDDKTRNIEMKLSGIADALNISEKTASRCIKYLADKDFIQIYKRSQSFGFTVNEDLARKTNNMPFVTQTKILLGQERRDLQ